MRWTITLAAVALIAGGGYAAYQRFGTARILVTEVVEAPVVQAFYATGTLLPDREYPINSNLEGVVTQVLVDKGTPVKAGQKLAFVRVDEFEMTYRQSQADLTLKESLVDEANSPTLSEYDKKLQAALEQLAIAERDHQRALDLRGKAVNTQGDVDRANDRLQTIWSAVETLKAQRAARKLELERDVAVARAALEIAQWNLSQQTIASPIDGMVLDRPVSVGTRVRVNDHLLQIANIEPKALVMRAAVDEEDKTRLSLGQKVNASLYSYPGRVFEARVKQVYPKADPERRTFEVDVQIDGFEDTFAAGMTGELAFIVSSKGKATVVPTQAVHDGSVWVVRDHQLVKTPVEVGLRSVERTEIVHGVAAGERVVISPEEDLREGKRVVTQYVEPATAAGLNKPAVETAMKTSH